MATGPTGGRDVTARPRVVVVALGGTIAMTPAGAGVTPSVGAGDLLEVLPEAKLDVDLAAEDFRRLPSASLTFDDVTELAATIRSRLDGSADGVVVTQGTDTLEESSYLLDLLHRRPEPVVVTGAMRTADVPGADGPANLLGAVRVAASPDARDQGCLVVMADEIHAARWVRKAHTTGPGAFDSPEAGPLGLLVEGRPRFVHRLTHRRCLPPGTDLRSGPAPRVGLVTVAMDDDGAILTAAADRCHGLVVAALGAGHVPADLVGPLARAAEDIPVVLASRTGAGPVLTSTYGFPGSERDLLAAGLIAAGRLHPLKARVLLHALLAATADRAAIAAAFGAAGGDLPADRWPWPLPPTDGPG